MAFTLAQRIEFEEEIKKSRFQAIAVPVKNADEVKHFLQQAYDPSTTHQCWAWKIGQQLRFNDDGEPSGTAGRPILACIEGQDLTNVLVLVNRWYGGIKLGTGGLVRAYGGCAGKCLLIAEKIELILKRSVQFQCQFNEWPLLEYELKQAQADYHIEYQANGVQISAELTANWLQHCAEKLQHISRGREQLHIMDEPQHD